MAGEVDTRSPENDSRCQHDAGAEQVAEDDFDAVIVPRLLPGRARLWGGRWRAGHQIVAHQIFPQNPL
jgi:hypothetical protein